MNTPERALILYVPALTISFSGESPYLPSYTVLPPESVTMRMNSLVSGISDDALVTSYDISEKWSLNVPVSASPFTNTSQECRREAAAMAAMMNRNLKLFDMIPQVLFGAKLRQNISGMFKINTKFNHYV